MKRLVAFSLLGILVVALLCLGASETLTNRTGKTASGVVITFSESVRISSYDESTFPDQSPSGRADQFTFSGGTLANGGRFKVSWSPSSATVAATQWLLGSATATSAAAATMGFATTNDTSVVTGDLLNPLYFARAAYVMQGVTDRDKVFALPLLGIPELSFFPTASGIDPSTVTWRFEVSHPEGISAEIRDNTLYIRGNSAAWSGYGAVTLTAIAGDASSSATIPVTVFRTDKTLITAEGKKDYFVPWSPQLDINRIKSVEQFLDEYAYDEENLDRRINWSAYEVLDFMQSVTFTGNWIGEGTFDPQWTWEATRMRIDYMLDELVGDGVDWIFWRSHYFMPTVTSSDIIQLFSVTDLNRGTTWMSTPPEGLRYLVNQAHNKGLHVAMGPFIADVSFARGVIRPDWDSWFASYAAVAKANAQLAHEMGADLLVVGDGLVNISGTISSREWGERFRAITKGARGDYAGPVTYLDRLLELYERNPSHYAAGDWLKQFPFAPELDILSSGSYFEGCVRSASPSASEVVETYRNCIETYVQPYVESLNKPLIFFENGIPNMDGVLSHFVAFSAGAWSSSVVDPQEQAVWYAALFEAMRDYSWFRGFGWFAVCIVLPGGIASTDGSFRGTPAESIVRSEYGGDTAPPPAAQIDGNPSEWSPANILHVTPASGGLEVSGRQEGNSLYLLLKFQAPWPVNNWIRVQFGASPTSSSGELLQVNYALGRFWGYLCGEPRCSTHIGQIDVVGSADRTCVELYVPLRLLDTHSPTRLSISLLDANFRTYLNTPILQVSADQDS